MKINYNKVYRAVFLGEKLPRKVKKFILSKRMSKSKLNRLIKSVEITQSADNMYEVPIIKPYTFCPNCGETKYFGAGSEVSYPEHWEYFHCFRCRKIVAYIDNSPFVHILENDNYFKNFN